MTDDVGFKGLEKNAAEHLNRKRNTKNVNKNQLKYVDDLTLAASKDLPKSWSATLPNPCLICTAPGPAMFYLVSGLRFLRSY